MQKKFLQILSMFLVLTLLVNMLPLQAIAQTLEATTTQAVISADAEVKNAKIVEEVTEKRTEYSKQFRLSNGLQMAVLYPDAVHYEANGTWSEIDNTLIASLDGTYTNTAGVWDVRFPGQMDGDSAIEIEKDGYTLSFTLDGELSLQSSGQLMAVGEASLQTNAIQSSPISVTPKDVKQLVQSSQYPETVAIKNHSQVSYNQVFDNTHIRYDLQSNTVKESVILERYDPLLRGYRYTLQVGQLQPVLQESGQIDFFAPEGKEPVMSMAAPFMEDAEQVFCADVQVTLTGENGVYTLTYLLPHEWLGEENRAWPVVLDPVVSVNLSVNNIEDRTVSQKNDQGARWGMNACGYSAKYGVHRCYLQYLELPALTSSDVLIGASISQYKAYASSTITTVEVHKVTEPWRSANITWSDKPDFNTKIEDYAIVDSVAWYSWDVTDIVRDWYANGNYGMMFKASDAIETGGKDNFKQFYSADFGTEISRPQLHIFFRNNNGLENYWEYTSVSAGRAGTGYVNNYTGNLVWVRSDMGFGGNRMPVSISHVYNLGDKENNEFGTGNGWRTNFNQRISSTTIDGSKFYIWEDSDGTRHYFQNKSYGVFEDEDGLELTLRSVSVAANTGVTGGVYSITDKMGNVSVFDTHGRLIRQLNNQETKSSIAITYTTASGRKISTVTDGVGREYHFTYTNDLLTRIAYLGSNAYQTAHPNTEIAYTAFGYDENGNLTTVTDQDGKVSTYTYTGKILTSAKDIDDYKVTYTFSEVPENSTWTPYRVTGIAESHGNTPGGSTTLEYAHNQTRFTDHNGTVLIKQFNDFGNTVCVQDDEGHAQYSKYAFHTGAQKDANTDATAKSNQLRLSSNMQNSVGSLAKDGSFENDIAWSAIHAGSTLSRTTEEAYEGNYSLKITEEGFINIITQSPGFQANPGETYTISAYVKAPEGGVSIGFHVAGGNESAYNKESVDMTMDWTRVHYTYTNKSDTAKTITPMLFYSFAETVYVDCVQIERAAAPSRLNLIENGDFAFGLQGWTGEHYTTETVGSAAPVLESTAVKVTGDFTSDRELSQTVPISGEANETLILTGWAKGDSAPLKDDRAFGLSAKFHYTDGTTGDAIKVNFNQDARSNIHWQYAATPLVSKKAYSSVTVSICYNDNVNTAWFDGIQLYREEFGSSYTYDEDGNIVSIVDLQKQKTEYEYTNNDLTKMILPSGVEYTYEYDSYHNVKTATTEDGLKYRFTYDTHGNNTSVSAVAGDSVMTASAAYSSNGNCTISTTDALGKITRYGYNEQTNLLDWVQYPEDTEATRTEYTYDNMFRTASAAAQTDTGLAMSVQYTYQNDLLKTVQSPTTTYTFNYGVFGLRSNVKVGNRTLASYVYTNDQNFYLSALDYNNGDGIQYTYDEKGRLIQQVYEDGVAVTYQYDNDGALTSVTDSSSGITTRYFYDYTGRATKYTETGEDFSHTVAYTYNSDNNLSQLVETVNGTTYTTSYTYDKDNRITEKTTNGITEEYTYDALGRLTQQVTKNGETTVKTETYTYNGNSSQVTTYRSHLIGGYTLTNTYSYDDNGNILSVSDGTNTTSYVYDSQNQLIQENNQASNFTRTWTYDNAGNILKRQQYAYTTGEITGTGTTTSYGYGDKRNWRDLLTSYDGKTITYDEIGNPLTKGSTSYTWEHGRQLATIEVGSIPGTYGYNADGLRTARTYGAANYRYIYSGDKLVQMQYTSSSTNAVLNFTYDAQGTPVGFTANGAQFYYLTNLQGDVVAVTNASGLPIARYKYDAWGNCTVTSNHTMGQINPLRYRGYVYDVETDLYYLQSRYYDPQMGRFLNGDGYTSTGQGLTGNNMFVYCGNNPIARFDPNGQCYGYLDNPYLDSLYSGINFGIPCGMYGVHVRHARISTPYRDVTKEINIALAKEYYRIKNGQQGLIYAVRSILGPIGLIDEYYDFYTLVNHGAPWDIKLEDQWNAKIKTPYPGPKTIVYFQRMPMTPEALGNFTYRVLGYWYNMSLYTLHLGSYYAAGFPQSGPALSNELKDWYYINLGYTYGTEHNKWRP